MYKIHEDKSPNIYDYFHEGKVDLVINIVDKHIRKDVDDDYFIRRLAIDNNILIFTKLSQVKLFSRAVTQKKLADLQVKSWNEYL